MPDLLSGTVTFLFTDFVGSAACWDHDHQAMAVAVKRHIVLLDAAIHAHGGLHNEGLPATSTGRRHRKVTWWSVNSMAGNTSSAGSANFAK